MKTSALFVKFIYFNRSQACCSKAIYHQAHQDMFSWHFKIQNPTTWYLQQLPKTKNKSESINLTFYVLLYSKDYTI